MTTETVMAPVLMFLVSGEAAGANGLRRIPVSMIVSGYKGKQRFSVTRADLDQVVANFRKRKTGDVVIDYDHSTLAAGDGEPKPAAGWLKEIDAAPDAKGVLWGSAEFTERAAKMLDAREYKYVSPVTDWSVRDKESGEQQGATITSVALTNSPLFEGLPAMPLVASDDAGWKFDRGDVVEIVKEKDVKISKVVLATLAAGQVRLVADDNTESLHTVEGLTVVTLADVKRGSDGKFDFSKLPQGDGVLVASEVLRAMDVQTEVDAAIATGKILPAQRSFYEASAMTDPAGFKTLVASMKPAVDLTEHGVGSAGDGSELERIEGTLDTKVKAKLAASAGMQYHEALKLVASENPELDKRRTALIRSKGGDD